MSDWMPPVPQPPPPRGYGYYPPPALPPQRQPSKTLAIIALVLAIVPCGINWLVAVVLAIIVLVQVGKGTARGRGLAIAALVISFLWFVATAVAVTFVIKESTKYDDARTAGEGTVSSDMMRAGDCLSELPGGGEITTVEIVPCSKPHLGETYGVFSIDADENSSQDEIYDLAGTECDARFIAFVGTTLMDSELQYSLIAPDKDDVRFDDDVACYVYAPGKTLTGTLEGSKR